MNTNQSTDVEKLLYSTLLKFFNTHNPHGIGISVFNKDNTQPPNALKVSWNNVSISHDWLSTDSPDTILRWLRTASKVIEQTRLASHLSVTAAAIPSLPSYNQSRSWDHTSAPSILRDIQAAKLNLAMALFTHSGEFTSSPAYLDAAELIISNLPQVLDVLDDAYNVYLNNPRAASLNP